MHGKGYSYSAYCRCERGRSALKLDLHCHSHFSDGKHAPRELLEFAAGQELSYLAITDHDSVDAHMTIAAHRGYPNLLPGVEISCNWQGQELHVLGLLIDIHDEQLSQLLDRQQRARRERMDSMDRRLAALGIHGLAEHFKHQHCVAQTRSYVADFLIQEGVCKNRAKAFKRFLGRRGKAYVAIEWCSLAEAVARIVASGGIAVLAHPGRYPIGRLKLQSLLSEFAHVGGEAMEVSYGNLDPLQLKKLASLALEHSLYASMGSDFHDASAHWTGIGKFPSLPQESMKNAIWEHPRWHQFTSGTTGR